jgi:hypothetical protein
LLHECEVAGDGKQSDLMTPLFRGLLVNIDIVTTSLSDSNYYFDVDNNIINIRKVDSH